MKNIRIGDRRIGEYRHRVEARESGTLDEIVVFHGEGYQQRRYEWSSVHLTREQIAKLAKTFPVNKEDEQ